MVFKGAGPDLSPSRPQTTPKTTSPSPDHSPRNDYSRTHKPSNRASRTRETSPPSAANPGAGPPPFCPNSSSLPRFPYGRPAIVRRQNPSSAALTVSPSPRDAASTIDRSTP